MPRLARPAASALTLAALLAGCAQPGPLSSRKTVMGGLKSSVVQLESEKEELKKELADLKAENRRMNDRLVQEESANGDLAARLDGAKNILRNQGIDGSSLASPSRTDLEPDPLDNPRPRRVSPGGRPAPKARKAPFAEIRARPYPDADEVDPLDETSASRPDDEAFVPDSARSRDPRWLPVARGLSEPKTRR